MLVGISFYPTIARMCHLKAFNYCDWEAIRKTFKGHVYAHHKMIGKLWGQFKTATGSPLERLLREHLSAYLYSLKSS